jgi:hypothetical protein
MQLLNQSINAPVNAQKVFVHFVDRKAYIVQLTQILSEQKKSRQASSMVAVRTHIKIQSVKRRKQHPRITFAGFKVITRVAFEQAKIVRHPLARLKKLQPRLTDVVRVIGSNHSKNIQRAGFSPVGMRNKTFNRSREDIAPSKQFLAAPIGRSGDLFLHKVEILCEHLKRSDVVNLTDPKQEQDAHRNYRDPVHDSDQHATKNHQLISAHEDRCCHTLHTRRLASNHLPFSFV